MLKLYLFPLLLGVAATITGTFFVLAVFGHWVMSMFTVLIFLAGGILLARMQRPCSWYAPVLMNVPLWVRFPPTSIDGYSLGLPIGALLSAYVGLYMGSHFPATVKVSDRRSMVSAAKAFLLASFVGILGMLLSYFFIFVFNFHLELACGTSNALAFLLVYPLLAAILANQNRDRWLTSAVGVCLLPSLYIYQHLLFSPNSALHVDGRIQWNFTFDNDAILLVTLPMTLLLSCLAAYVTVRFRSRTRELSKPETNSGRNEM